MIQHSIYRLTRIGPWFKIPWSDATHRHHLIVPLHLPIVDAIFLGFPEYFQGTYFRLWSTWKHDPIFTTQKSYTRASIGNFTGDRWLTESLSHNVASWHNTRSSCTVARFSQMKGGCSSSSLEEEAGALMEKSGAWLWSLIYNSDGGNVWHAGTVRPAKSFSLALLKSPRRGSKFNQSNVWPDIAG